MQNLPAFLIITLLFFSIATLPLIIIDDDLDDDSCEPPNLNGDLLPYADAEASSAPPDLQSNQHCIDKQKAH